MLLPENKVLSAMVERYARLLSRFGKDIGERPLVLPNGDYFPDPFSADEVSVSRLVKRMQRHAGMTDIPVRVGLVEVESSTGAQHSCSSGSCALPDPTQSSVSRVVDQGDSWQLNAPEPEVNVPDILTTHLARSLGFVFLEETRPEQEPIEAPLEVSAELAATALGFGVLLLQGSYVYKKSCGGPSVGRFTTLSCPELAVATALFIELHGHKKKAALRELDATQKEALSEALEWTRSNPELIERLRRTPQRVELGDYELKEATSWLGRVLQSRRRKPDSDGDLESLEALLASGPASAPKPRKPKDEKEDELRALVDEALETRADAE